MISVAKQYQNQGLTLREMINEGKIPAANAMMKRRGSKHSRIVRLPCNQITLSSKLHKTFSKLEPYHGRKPSVEELAESLVMLVEKVSELLNKSDRNLSIDEPLRQDKEHTLDVLQNNDSSPDRYIIHDSITKEIRSSLKILDNRDRELLVLFLVWAQALRYDWKRSATGSILQHMHAD